MFFWFFSYLFCSNTLLAGLVIYDHSNYPLASPTNDEYMPARGVISLTIWSLLPTHIICNGRYNLVLIFSLSDRVHQLAYDWLLCSIVTFISYLRASSIAKYLTSRSSMPAYASIFIFFFLNPCQGRFVTPKSFVDPPPLPSYAIHTKNSLEDDTVPFGCCILGVTRMMFGFLKKMKRKMMFVEAFVLFPPVTLELNGGS